tara:strand:+ start:2238 stop:2783 length:546 start_codon:yes stop_codon:yes gene_type:complete
MPSTTIQLSLRKGVQVDERDKVVAVYQRGETWVVYTDQESDSAIKLIDTYLDNKKAEREGGGKGETPSLEDKFYETVEDLEETIDEVEEAIENLKTEKKWPLAKKEVVTQKDVQDSVNDAIDQINNENFSKNKPVSLRVILRQILITQTTSLRFVLKKYGNAVFTFHQWKEIFIKENIIDS